jgi:hypothetical protein
VSVGVHVENASGQDLGGVGVPAVNLVEPDGTVTTFKR